MNVLSTNFEFRNFFFFSNLSEVFHSDPFHLIHYVRTYIPTIVRCIYNTFRAFTKNVKIKKTTKTHNYRVCRSIIINIWIWICESCCIVEWNGPTLHRKILENIIRYLYRTVKASAVNSITRLHHQIKLKLIFVLWKIYWKI